MQQLSLLPRASREHGGVLSVGKRRGRRPLSTGEALHLTLRSDHAKGARSLLKHRDLIDAIAKKASRRFNVKIYRQAICGNHVHFLIKGKRRKDLQNFFRVFAGHIAQSILRRVPMSPAEVKLQRGCAKNQRKFWQLLSYTRVLSWGREFRNVADYIVRNVLESLNLIAYQPRKALKPRLKPHRSPSA